MPTAPPTTRRLRHQPRSVALIVLFAVLAVVAGLGVAAEAYVRHRVTSCLASSVSTAIGGPVEIGLSKKPLLLTLVDRRVPYLTVDSDNATLGTAGGPQLTDLQVRSRFNGLQLPGSDGRGGHLDSSAATVSWPAPAITSSVRAQPFGGLITQINADGAADALRVQFLGGLGSTSLRPTVQAGRITIETVDAKVLGFGVPAGVVQQVVNLLSGNLSTFPLGLMPTSARVTDEGVQLMLAGGHADLPAFDRGANDCAVL